MPAAPRAGLRLDTRADFALHIALAFLSELLPAERTLAGVKIMCDLERLHSAELLTGLSKASSGLASSRLAKSQSLDATVTAASRGRRSRPPKPILSFTRKSAAAAVPGRGGADGEGSSKVVDYMTTGIATVAESGSLTRAVRSLDVLVTLVAPPMRMALSPLAPAPRHRSTAAIICQRRGS